MKAQDLSIYQVTYKLLEKVARYSSGFPRNWKISLAARLQNECVEMVMDVYRANAARSGRAEIVSRILERVKVVELMIRLCRDMTLINIKQHASIVKLTDQVGRQAYRWAEYSRNTGQNARRQGSTQ